MIDPYFHNAPPMKNVPGYDTVLNIRFPKNHELSGSNVTTGNTMIFRSKAAAIVDNKSSWVLRESYTNGDVELRTAIEDEKIESFYARLVAQIISEDERETMEKECGKLTNYQVLLKLGFVDGVDKGKNDTDAQMERED